MQEITKKQLITLIILFAVLLASLGYQILIRPVADEYDKYSMKADTLKFSYDDMLMQQSYYEGAKLNYADQLAQSAVITDALLPPTTSDVLDQLITRMFLSSGMTITSLEISDAFPHTISYEVPEEEKKKQDEVEAAAPDEGPVSYETGIQQCDLTYEALGTYAALRNVLQAVASNPSMSVTGLSFETDGNVAGTETVFKATVLVSVYMYAPIEAAE